MEIQVQVVQRGTGAYIAREPFELFSLEDECST